MTCNSSWKCNNSKKNRNSDTRSLIRLGHLCAKSVALASPGRRLCCLIQRYSSSELTDFSDLKENHFRCTAGTRYTNVTVVAKYFGICNCFENIKNCNMPVRIVIPNTNPKMSETIPIRKRIQSTAISIVTCAACPFIVQTCYEGIQKRTSNTITVTMSTQLPSIVVTSAANRLLKVLLSHKKADGEHQIILSFMNFSFRPVGPCRGTCAQSVQMHVMRRNVFG